MRTLRDLVERNARLHAETTYLVFGERRPTFREFTERARRLASALHGGGLEVQDRFAILSMNCAEFLEVYGAAEVAPFIVTPVNFRLAPPEVLYILRDAAPTVLFFEKQYEATVASLRGHVHEYRGIPMIVTYHPAYLLRSLPDKAKAWEDLCFARRTMADLRQQA